LAQAVLAAAVVLLPFHVARSLGKMKDKWWMPNTLQATIESYQMFKKDQGALDVH